MSNYSLERLRELGLFSLVPPWMEGVSAFQSHKAKEGRLQAARLQMREIRLRWSWQRLYKRQLQLPDDV